MKVTLTFDFYVTPIILTKVEQHRLLTNANDANKLKLSFIGVKKMISFPSSVIEYRQRTETCLSFERLNSQTKYIEDQKPGQQCVNAIYIRDYLIRFFCCHCTEVV